MKLKALLLSMLLPLMMSAAIVEVPTNLWQGSQSLPLDWSGFIQIEASKFAQAATGNDIAVSVSETDDACEWPQVMLNNSSWATAADTQSQIVSSTPTVLKFKVTDNLLAELKAGGVIVKGCGATITSIDLIKYETTGGGKGDPASQVWTGSQAIDWGAAQGWLAIPAANFMEAAVGKVLRFNIADVKAGAQGHIVSGSWSDMPDATDFIQLSGAYYEFTITEAMLAQLNAGGCVVSGVGYTLTSVELIDKANIPVMQCSLDASSINVWEVGEQPVIKVTIKNLEESEMTIPVSLSVATDHYTPFFAEAKKVTVAAGATVDVTFPLTLTPGFYHAIVCANYSQLKDFNIGYDATGIVSAPDYQSDFASFWDGAKAKLAGVAPEYKLTLIPEKSTAARNVYLVEMNSVADTEGGEPAILRAYFAEPVAAGSYRAVISYQGYDSGGYDPYCPHGDAHPDMIELVVSTRGQLVNNRPPYTNTYGDWFVYNFGDKDHYYYHGAYMDVVRAIDFIASREKTDKSRIFAEGQSQGGALTIAAAALDKRIRAIAPSIPFMGDFPDYFVVGAWPAYPAHQKQAELGMSDEDMFKFLSYFDTKNLATLISCPVMMTYGLQDNVCPPHTNIAPYNNLPASVEKSVTFNPTLMHQVPADWNTRIMDFFEKFPSTPSSVDAVGTDSQVKVVTNGRNIMVTGNDNEDLTLYSLDGSLVATATAGNSIDAPSCGFFILSIGKSTSTKVYINK